MLVWLIDVLYRGVPTLAQTLDLCKGIKTSTEGYVVGCPGFHNHQLQTSIKQSMHTVSQVNSFCEESWSDRSCTLMDCSLNITKPYPLSSPRAPSAGFVFFTLSKL